MDIAANLMKLCNDVDGVLAGYNVVVGDYFFVRNPNGTYTVGHVDKGTIYKERTETETIILMAWAYKEVM